MNATELCSPVVFLENHYLAMSFVLFQLLLFSFSKPWTQGSKDRNKDKLLK